MCSVASEGFGRPVGCVLLLVRVVAGLQDVFCCQSGFRQSCRMCSVASEGCSGPAGFVLLPVRVSAVLQDVI